MATFRPDPDASALQVFASPAWSTLLLEGLALPPPHAPQLVHLPDLATENEDHCGIVHPEDHADDRRERPGVERAGVEGGDVRRVDVLRDLEEEAGEHRRHQRGL